ncbi:MAG: hypothetical protein QHJ81_14775 [Anaerolineae bacterium]|nr:hypothetical protein [Anaerolineae bacterium]
MNDLAFALFARDLSDMTLAGGLKFEGCTIGTQLHGGFGEFRGRLPLDEYNAYRWYSEYHNCRLVVWTKHQGVGWEGRIEDVTITPGFGVEVGAFGYWRNCFDVPLKDEETWATGTHYPEEIIQAVIERCCQQIRHDFTNFVSLGRNVAPYKIDQYRYPQAIIAEVLEGGDKQGNAVYFAVWEDRLPYLFTKPTKVNWYVRLQDCERPPELTRSLETMANAVLCEYSIEGEAGDMNDEGTATGERANNYITLTDTKQGWKEGQWNRGFDVALVGGTGAGQVRDILDTRLEPEVVDEGKADLYDSGVSVATGAGPPELKLEDTTKDWVSHQWKDEDNPYYVEIIGGPCAGQSRRRIVDNGPMGLVITPAWEADDGKYPSSRDGGGSVYHIYRPNEIQDRDKSWANDAYNLGYMVEVVKGRGAGQRRKITDTRAVVVGQTYGQYGKPIGGGTSFHVLTVEPDWDTAPDDTSYYEIHKEAKVVEAGKATGGSRNTIEDGEKTWREGQYNDGYEVYITKGACANQTGKIVDTAEHTLTVEPLWDDDVPDATSEYEIRVIEEKAEEKEDEAACTQLVVTTAWTTQPDATTRYEIRQKEEGGLLERSITHTSTRSIDEMRLCRKGLFSLGTSTPGEAERVAGQLLAKLRDPQQRTSEFSIRRVFNTRWIEYPLLSVRAGDVVEIVDLFAGQDESAELDALRRFFIIRTSYDQRRQVLALTPDTVEMGVATLLASARK